MTEKTPQQAAAKNIKEVSKIMMLQSRRFTADKKCFKFPPKVWPNQFGPSMMPYFVLRLLGIFLGIETSAGNLGEAGTSIVSLSFFPDQPWKEHYIRSCFTYSTAMSKWKL